MLLSLFNQRLMFATHNKRCHIPTNSTDDSCNAYYAFPPNSLQHISPCVVRYALLKGVSCCSGSGAQRWPRRIRHMRQRGAEDLDLAGEVGIEGEEDGEKCLGFHAGVQPPRQRRVLFRSRANVKRPIEIGRCTISLSTRYGAPMG